MNLSDTVDRAKKYPSFETELVVGEIHNLRDCWGPPNLTSRLSGSIRTRLEERSLEDVRNCKFSYVHKQFLTEVILMDNTEKKLEIPAEVREFLEGILLDAKMTYADEAMHEELINELFARLDNYMTSVLVDCLPAEKLDEFIKMNGENKSREEVEEYIKNNVPNAQDVLTKAFMNFRDMYLSGVTVARNAPESTASADSSGESKEDGDQKTEDQKGENN